jgi:hypothetical protein
LPENHAAALVLLKTFVSLNRKHQIRFLPPHLGIYTNLHHTYRLNRINPFKDCTLC